MRMSLGVHPPSPQTPLSSRHEGVLVSSTTLGPALGTVAIAVPDWERHPTPGQFSMIWRPPPPGVQAEEQPRPFACFRVTQPGVISFLVRERAETVHSLLRAPMGTRVALTPPLGSGFPALTGHVWAVAGGVGVAAFGGLFPVADGRHLRLLFGLRNHAEDGLAAAMETLPLGAAEIHVTREQAGAGGDVVTLLEQQLASEHAPDAIWACGPDGMLRRIRAIARDRCLPLWLSLPTPLACGVGHCGQCSYVDKRGGLHLACIDGPVVASDALPHE